MKSKVSLVSALIFSVVGLSQVPKKIVVEHFTNTKCSICASRNPGFFNNYDTENSQETMIHLAIHPSSPYNTCVLYQQNPDGNDDRTNYYGILGSTPRLVISGEIIPSSSSYNSPTLFAPYLNETSPISLTLEQQKFGNDSIRIRIVIRTEASHSLSSQNLYVVLAEDTVFYNAPNGENQHYDVFRTALLGNTGTTISVPSTVGDSLVFMKTVSVDAAWDVSRVFAMAILQNVSDKSVTQAEALKSTSSGVISGFANTVKPDFGIKIYPNPAYNEVFVSVSEVTSFIIYDVGGNRNMKLSG